MSAAQACLGPTQAAGQTQAAAKVQATAVHMQAEQLAAVPVAAAAASQPQAPSSAWRTKKRKSGGRHMADHGNTAKSKRLSAGRRLNGRQSFRTGWSVVSKRKWPEMALAVGAFANTAGSAHLQPEAQAPTAPDLLTWCRRCGVGDCWLSLMAGFGACC